MVRDPVQPALTRRAGIYGLSLIVLSLHLLAINNHALLQPSTGTRLAPGIRESLRNTTHFWVVMGYLVAKV